MGTDSDLDPQTASTGDEDPLYIDDAGIPMLFDVVIPGEHLRAAGIVLAPQADEQAPAPERPPVDQAARLEAAIEAALPAVLERAAVVLRNGLIDEVQQRLEHEPSSDER